MAFDSKFYLSIFWRRFPYFLVVAAAVAAIGLFIASILPPVYQSQAVLLVESEQITVDNKPSGRSKISEMLQTIQQRLLSRSSLLEMANALDIYGDDSELNPDQIVKDMRKRTKFEIQQRKGEAPLLTVSFSAGTGEMSAKVTNEFVTRILKENLNLRTSRATDTLRFFEQEEKRLSQELDRMNAEILKFKLANRDSLPDSLAFRRARQTALQENLTRLEQEQADLQEERDRLVELFDNDRLTNLPQENMSSEEIALQKARANLDAARATFSDTNPKVKVLIARVQALEKQVAEQRGGRIGPDSGEDPRVSANTVLYELQLKKIDGQLAFNQKQMDDMRKELAFLKKTIDETPANSIRQANLERDHSLIRAQYDEAVAALAKAKTGEIIETRSKGQRIAVIEQAAVPTEPASPPRLLIAIGSVVAGIFAGLGVVFLLELMNRAVRRPVEITAKLGITPIATLPFTRTRGETLRRRAIIYLALGLVLIGIPALLYAIHTYYMPMDVLLQRIMDKTGLSVLLEQIRQDGA